MDPVNLLLVAGVFLGGAAPWLEAVVVVPVGILAGLHPVVALVAGAAGNLLTVGVAAWFGERLREWWAARRRARTGAVAEEPTKRRQRVERFMQKWGLPPLALVLGPVGLGTQLSALVAVGLGTSARAAFLWVGAGTVLWSLIAAAATLGGISVLGVGA